MRVEILPQERMREHYKVDGREVAVAGCRHCGTYFYFSEPNFRWVSFVDQEDRCAKGCCWLYVLRPERILGADCVLFTMSVLDYHVKESETCQTTIQ